MNKPLSLKKFKIEQATPLDFTPSWPDRVHQFSSAEAIAIVATQLAQRPLLIEGPPGSGKTQIAAAAAAVLNRELITYVVNSNTQPEDLLWQYDALQRLNDAQTDRLQDIERYLRKGPLWLAFEDEGTHKNITSSITAYKPKTETAQGKVVLIDEIDKADRSVPNSLLDVFGHRRFYCPHIQDEIGAGNELNSQPLIIITSNREQQLPPAFVRRCLVLRISLPSDPAEFVSKLAQRAELHFESLLTSAQYEKIAQSLFHIREISGLPDELQPGQAEYFDLIRAIGEAMAADIRDQEGKRITFDTLLKDLQGLVFDKAKLLDA